MTSNRRIPSAYRYLNSSNKVTFSLAILSTLCSLNAYSQQTDQERIQDLEQRLLELEEQIQITHSTNTNVHQEEIVEEVIIIAETEQRASHKFTAPDKSITLSNSDTTLQIGGQIWLDAIFNKGEMTNRAGFQPSSIAYEDNTMKDDVLLTAGQSKLSFQSFTPTQYGAMKTRFEFDMFDSQGNANFHLTHLWAEIGNVGAGQTFSGFMDINAFPNVLEYWGPNSMVFVRQPQVRYTTTMKNKSQFIFTVEKASSALATPRNNLTPATDITNNQTTDIPDITAAYLYNDDFGYIKSVAILRKVGYETATTQDSTIGWGINVSGLVKFTDEESIQFQVLHGEGIGRYINDPCCNYYSNEAGGTDAGLDTNGDLTAIPITAGFVYFNKQWDEKWSSAIGYSYLTVDNLSTQTDRALKNSTYSSANLLWSPTEQIKTGIELQYGDVQSYFGDKGDDYRIQTSIGFKY